MARSGLGAVDTVEVANTPFGCFSASCKAEILSLHSTCERPNRDLLSRDYDRPRSPVDFGMLLVLCLRSRATVAAENLFVRK